MESSTSQPPHIEMEPEPRNIAALPHDKHGRPVPWFVAWIDGKPDFRIIAPGKIREAVRDKLCWVCGKPAGSYKAFVIAGMCAINRTSAEPPCHRDCAIYSARNCPFLTTPNMTRREGRIPEGAVAPAGIMIRRNPGVALAWITRSFQIERHGDGTLFRLGDPTETLWYAKGREATRAEVDESIETGLPILRAEAEKNGPDAVAELDTMIEAVQPFLPGGDGRAVKTTPARGGDGQGLTSKRAAEFTALRDAARLSGRGAR